MTNTPKFSNRLKSEKSPYLLQHAHNPVDWFAWGEEAFTKAKTENKPIFLSIGYSTCHWCHVMEKESFENEAIAKLLNEYFISIKVDREERPDLDKIYMTFVQASTGSGGWPMSVWLTPDLKPFYGGTYFPPSDKYGRPGFPTMLEKITGTWQNERQKVLDAAESTTTQLQSLSSFHAEDQDANLDSSVLDKCYQEIAGMYDEVYGGFGQAPKFPTPSLLEFMLFYGHQYKNKSAINMVLETLEKMADGGIHDLISQPGKGGGGFARYATDQAWHVPHFEKMLYDNAQLITLYIEAYQLSKNSVFAETAEDILNYVLCDMRSPDGGFYSAEDADSFINHGDSEKKEGGFYIWQASELNSLLTAEEFQAFAMMYDIREEGNVTADPHGEFQGYNILHVVMTSEQVANALNIQVSQVENLISSAKAKLYEARLKRPRPHLDDKILTSWNGLMISALAKASGVLKNPDYLAKAEETTRFILTHLYDENERKLYRRYRQGEHAIEGKADDYAFFIQGLIDLYEASFNPEYLQQAISLAEKQTKLFYDTEYGGFFNTDRNDPTILMALKDDHDGAEPSSNSISAINYFKLSQMTDREDFYDISKRSIFSFSKVLTKFGSHMPMMLVALGLFNTKSSQIIMSGSLNHNTMSQFRAVLSQYYKPGKILLHASVETEKILPFIKQLPIKNDEPTIYVCIDYACQLPLQDPQQFKTLLDGHSN